MVKLLNSETLPVSTADALLNNWERLDACTYMCRLLLIGTGKYHI